MSQTIGHISQIIGPVIDVYFDTKGEDPEKVLPKIYEALRVKRPDGRDLIIEVQQHIGEDTVRCVAMDNTDGLQRGLEAMRTGKSYHYAGWRSDQGPYDECHWSAYRRYGIARYEGSVPHPPRGSEV